jgi:hypothetical protein
MGKMSETPRERFDRLIREGPPAPQPKPKPLPPAAEVVPLNPWPVRRKWTAEPVATVNSVRYEPKDIDRLIELRRANAQWAREARMRHDPFGLGLYGQYETIDDVVRRQEGE